MKRFLQQVRDHFIICGFGEVGKETADELNRSKVPFVVVDLSFREVDKERFSSYAMIEGDAADDEVLDKAGISKARGLISCCPKIPRTSLPYSRPDR